MGTTNLPTSRTVHFVDESGGAWPWQRQLQSSQSSWGNTKYYFDMENHPDADWLVVFSAWPQMDFLTTIPRERRIFVAGEPESFHVYQPNFLNQFGTVLTTQSRCKHPNTIRSQVGINWFAGVRFQSGTERFKATLAFADFERPAPAKTKLCSVVCSDQTVTKGHRERLAFVNHLKHAFGDQIDYYGRGSRPMPDKDEALADYQFHIALENSRHPDYWTEKLADPILRGCYPIYSGCTNVLDYFPAQSLARIDTSRPTEAIEIIRKTLLQPLTPDAWEAMAIAKSRILYEYNIFPVLEKMFSGSALPDTAGSHAQAPGQLFSDHEIKNQKFSRRLKRNLKSLFSGQ
jgi:hypothetical protein